MGKRLAIPRFNRVSTKRCGNPNLEMSSSFSSTASIPSASPSEYSYSASLTSRVPFPNPPRPNASSLRREELDVATAEGTNESEGRTMELGREEKSLNGLWAAEK